MAEKFRGCFCCTRDKMLHLLRRAFRHRIGALPVFERGFHSRLTLRVIINVKNVRNSKYALKIVRIVK